jgi:hypothetical protein
MNATISFKVRDDAAFAPVAPAKVGHKTIAMDVEFVGCHVTISRTADKYYNVSARKGAFHGSAVTAAMVWFDKDTLQWVVDQHVTYGEAPMEITRTRSLRAALGVAQWQVSYDGHALGQW